MTRQERRSAQRAEWKSIQTARGGGVPLGMFKAIMISVAVYGSVLTLGCVGNAVYQKVTARQTQKLAARIPRSTRDGRRSMVKHDGVLQMTPKKGFVLFIR